MGVTLADITAADWSLKLGEPGSVVENLSDINQCIKVILETRKGTRAHEPLFGCDAWQYIDWPRTEAIPHVIAAVIEAVEEWEPRVDLVSVIPVADEDGTGNIRLQIEWELHDDDEVRQQIEVTL